MTQEIKEQIMQAVREYMQENSLSANEFSNLSEINPGYISNMLKNEFTIGEKKTPIAPRWFKKAAIAIDFKIEPVNIETMMTPQFKMITSTLEKCKEHSECAMLIGGTGIGKTYAVDRFCKRHPQHTYRLTVSYAHTWATIVLDMLNVLGLDERWRTKNKLELIGREMKKLNERGEQPIIILDEAENLKLGVIRVLKGLYDQVKDNASIVIIGTPELQKKLDRLKEKGTDGVPQFCRRFKAGTRHLPEASDYDMFLNKYVQDAGLRKLLLRISNNYGELVDYLLPVMREAKEQGKPLNESFFRLHWGNNF